MTLRELLPELLAQAQEATPTAATLRARFEPRSRKVSVAGRNLERPAWADSVTGAEDVYLELEGEIAGLHLSEDSRGWGAYVEFPVTGATLADLEALAGKTTAMVRGPGDFHSGDKAAVYVQRGGRTIRIFAELQKRGPELARVTVHFQR